MSEAQLQFIPSPSVPKSSGGPSLSGSPYTSDKGLTLQDLIIFPASGSQNGESLVGKIVELNLYENMFSPFYSGDLLISDSTDIINRLQLCGFEYIKVTLGKADVSQQIQKVFRVFKIDNMKHEQTTQTNQIIVLKFCSEELLLSYENPVFKSYNGKTPSAIISDILLNYVGANAKYIPGNIDPSSNQLAIIIPGWRPFEAIQWLTRRTSPLMFFYENRDGFKLSRLDNLYLQNPVMNYFFAPQNISLDSTTLSQNYQRVIKYSFGSDGNHHDIIKSIRNGMFGSSLVTFDLVRLQTTKVKFNGMDSFNPSLNPYPLTNGMTDRFNNLVTDYSGSLRRFYPTKTGLSVDPTITPLQPNILPNYVENYMLQNISKMENLNTFKVNLVVPGTMGVTAGDLITFGIPSQLLKDLPNSTNYDKFYSGKFLVLSVRHKVNLQTYESILECTTDSLNFQYTEANNDDTILAGLKSF